jgi:hypothetical protein
MIEEEHNHGLSLAPLTRDAQIWLICPDGS